MSLPKPYYEDPWCQIFLGDCREILPELPKVDLVLTDIPYGVVNRLSSGLRNLDKETADIETMPIGTLLSLMGNIAQSYYIWCATEQVSDLRASFSDAGLSTRLCIWEKTNPTPLNAQHLWLSSIK